MKFWFGCTLSLIAVFGVEKLFGLSRLPANGLPLKNDIQVLSTVFLKCDCTVRLFFADPLCDKKQDGKYPLKDPLMYLKCLGGEAILIPCPRNHVYDAKEQKCRENTATNQVAGDIACSGKQDGMYPRRDTFTYLRCSNGYGHVVNCPTNQVYIHRERRCRAVTIADQATFCEGLPNDDYRDPWNCHMFIKCYSGITYPFNCQLSELVFDPEKDQCVYSYQYTCTVVTSGNDVVLDIACSGRPDGKYPRSDTFTYLQCTSQVGHVVNCPANQVYIHREQRCRAVTLGDQNTFCEGLPNGDYRYPWNCHMFYKCFSGVTYPFNCQLPSLVFNPEKDQCVYTEEYPCTVVKSGNQLVAEIGDAACASKEDGSYPMPDTFKYLKCTNHVGTIESCGTNQVYIHRERRCRAVTAADQGGNICGMELGTGHYKDAVSVVIRHTIVTLTVVSALIQFSFSKGNCKSESFCIAATLCEGLPSGDYRDPWDCHKFFKCFVGQIFTFNCQKPPLRELVFHPQLDRCVYPRDFPCLTVKSSTKMLSVQANRCTGKSDGLYVIPDVFSYLECKSGSEIVHNCPANEIFVAKKMACSKVTTSAEDRFCDARQSGNYRNPWNCHNFITCVIGHPAPYDRPCHPPSLVYDPNTDRCEHAHLFPCKNLTSPTPTKNRCTGKADGLYILADVFKYLECKAGQEILHFCPSKQIFAPDAMACRAVVPADRTTFCNKRPTGNYRNPWNCHHFISCVTGHPVYDRPCHPLSLVYDPDNDLCEHDTLMTCVEV
eukprot:gene10231-18918_t